MTDPFNEFKEGNRHLWNTWTGLHESSSFYNLEGFRAGGLSLRPVEMEELAPQVKGKSLLHLMCHFGLDTLSLARLGARVTGVDLSDQAIELANRVSAEMEIPARFIASDIYKLTDALTDSFDIIFTSYGVLHWLPDLNAWARIIASYLKPGGIFYIVEDHPFMRVFDSDSPDELHVGNPYFFSEAPYPFETQTSYASEGKKSAPVKGYMWDHSLSDIFTALISAGLRIEFFHEFDFALRAKFPIMQQTEEGLWRLPAPLDQSVPLLFSLQARK